VYSSNIFAIMALRSLYTLVSAAVNHLEYIKPAVALVLAFVGVKMGLEYFHVEVSIAVSLGVVISILSGGVGASLIKRRLTAARAPPVPKQHGLPLEEP
jgi:predicted tellurium resistance membrane protein TerC